MNSMNSAEQLAECLAFMVAARQYYNHNRVAAGHPEVQRIRAGVEEIHSDGHGKPVVYQKMESTYYEDAPALVTLLGFLERYDRARLRTFLPMIGTELGGLRADFHPAAIMRRSILGTVALVIAIVISWSGFVALVSGESGNVVTAFLHSLLSDYALSVLTALVWLGGIGVMLWYGIRTMRNRRQVAFLGSLQRAMQLYLGDA